MSQKILISFPCSGLICESKSLYRLFFFGSKKKKKKKKKPFGIYYADFRTHMLFPTPKSFITNQSSILTTHNRPLVIYTFFGCRSNELTPAASCTSHPVKSSYSIRKSINILLRCRSNELIQAASVPPIQATRQLHSFTQKCSSYTYPSSFFTLFPLVQALNDNSFIFFF